MAKKKTNKKVVKKNTAKKITKKTIQKSTAKKAAKKPPKKATKKPAVKKPAPQLKKDSKQPTRQVDYSKAITPLGSRLVVRLSLPEKITAGGIIIPQTSSVAGHLRGEVLAAGHGEKNKKGYVRPMDVQKGDEVLFSEFSGTKVVFNSEELLIIQESDILGIIQN